MSTTMSTPDKPPEFVSGNEADDIDADGIEKVDLRQFESIEEWAEYNGIDVEVAEDAANTSPDTINEHSEPLTAETDESPSGYQDSPTTCLWIPPRKRADDPRRADLATGPIEADVFNEAGEEVDNVETTIGAHVVDWLKMSGVTLHQATEFARVSAQNPDAERTLWAKLTTDRTNAYCEIVRAVVHAYDAANKGERETATLTYDELEDQMNNPLSRPKLSERVGELCDGGVLERGGMPTTIGFPTDDIATLATVTLAKTDPYHN